MNKYFQEVEFSIALECHRTKRRCLLVYARGERHVGHANKMCTFSPYINTFVNTSQQRLLWGYRLVSRNHRSGMPDLLRLSA